MKKIFLAAITLLWAATFTACKKDNAATSKTFEGIYVGKWGDITGDPHTFFKLEFKPGGALTRYNESGAITATGTWTLTGIEMEASYTHSANNEKHSIKGIYTDFNGEIMGTWGYGNNKANGGKFLIKK
ncbi:MAG TPA: hypothetical protein VK907_01205 [Phnomibacter sp.]|nr:hypothetical protein [Phnomibacter sp.]